MTWRTDFENAPKGETKKQTFRHHKSGKVIEKELTLKVPVLISIGDQVIQSFWSEAREQWVGLATDEVPDGWMPWPDPMEVPA